MWFVTRVCSEDVVQFLGGFFNKNNAVVFALNLIEDDRRWIGLVEYNGECQAGWVDVAFKFGPLLRVQITGVYPVGLAPQNLINDLEVYEEVLLQ